MFPKHKPNHLSGQFDVDIEMQSSIAIACSPLGTPLSSLYHPTNQTHLSMAHQHDSFSPTMQNDIAPRLRITCGHNQTDSMNSIPDICMKPIPSQPLSVNLGISRGAPQRHLQPVANSNCYLPLRGRPIILATAKKTSLNPNATPPKNSPQLPQTSLVTSPRRNSRNPNPQSQSQDTA